MQHFFCKSDLTGESSNSIDVLFIYEFKHKRNLYLKEQLLDYSLFGAEKEVLILCVESDLAEFSTAQKSSALDKGYFSAWRESH